MFRNVSLSVQFPFSFCFSNEKYSILARIYFSKCAHFTIQNMLETNERNGKLLYHNNNRKIENKEKKNYLIGQRTLFIISLQLCGFCFVLTNHFSASFLCDEKNSISLINKNLSMLKWLDWKDTIW